MKSDLSAASTSESRAMTIDQFALAFTLVLVIGISIWASFGKEYYIVKQILACQISGYGALGLLAASILFGPILRAGGWIGIRVAGRRSAMISKNTGIASALAAWAHALIGFFGYLNGKWRDVVDQPYLYGGLAALIIFTLLLVVSIKRLMAHIGWHLWKPTFRLSLAAAVLVLYHMMYAPFATMRWTLGLYAVALVVFLLRFLPARRCKENQTASTSDVTVVSREIET